MIGGKNLLLDDQYFILFIYVFIYLGPGIFPADKIRINQAEILKGWFWTCMTSFSHMDQPPLSPDLDSIKKCTGCAGEDFIQAHDSPSLPWEREEKWMQLLMGINVAQKQLKHTNEFHYWTRR